MMIFFIDVIGAPRPPQEPEILSRIIDHDSSAAEAKRKARAILTGVDFVGARAVRVLDRDGREIFSQALRPR
jgi:hypothetical protein